jgi:hypothetical protein
MKKHYKIIFPFLLAAFLLALSCSKEKITEEPEPFELFSVNVGTKMLSLSGENTNLPFDQKIMIRFTAPVDTASVKTGIILIDDSSKQVPAEFSYLDNFETVSLLPQNHLEENTLYTLTLSDEIKGQKNQPFEAVSLSFATVLLPLTLQSVYIGAKEVHPAVRMQDVNLQPEIKLVFSHQLPAETLLQNIFFESNNEPQEITVTQTNNPNEFLVQPTSTLLGLMKNEFGISEDLQTEKGNVFEGFATTFYTKADSVPKFPLISDDELLTLIQKQTFNYFWDFGHPVSGLARERNTSGETVTSGGSGFGLMAIIVGMERGFIARTEGIERLQTIVDFLANAERFHGAWPHWLDGTTGKVKPFSTKDNGGDLVETSYLAAGLLAVRQYLNPQNADENGLISKINDLWNSIEWNWYTKGGENVLYWHWSPNYGWEMNHKIQGYNEALITYILAASSEKHAVSADVYHEGWAKNGAIINGKNFYSINLPLGYDYGGPLFFAHYSFLGINPKNLSDQYANYWLQNKNHTLINREHCIENPNNFVGYSDNCWGLTASDNPEGYSAHSPTNDLGVIAPTAAVSSLPFTPEESMQAIRFFYYTLGDRLWGEYGFYDAFDITEGWVAGSYLAIDQGPIVIMIENYRTGLIWDLLMSCPEVQSGLTKLGFTY